MAEISGAPSPAPSWLRNSVPVGSMVYIQGEPAGVEVTAHRGDSRNYWVLVETPAGIRPIPYNEILDEAGNPLLEPREFVRPANSGPEQPAVPDPTEQDIAATQAPAAPEADEKARQQAMYEIQSGLRELFDAWEAEGGAPIAGARVRAVGSVTAADESAAMELAEQAFEALSPEQQALLDRVAAEQINRVLDQWRGMPGFMLAPNGQPTKLNERQWAQVRTPLFKRWFGDWEALIEISSLARTATEYDAKESLKSLAGRKIRNIATDTVAEINSEQRNKIVSSKALAASLANGFTAGEHNGAAAGIATLWKHAEIIESRPDAAGDKNIASIKRFASPFLTANGETAVAYLTVKESVEHGHRIYSVELTEIRKLRREVARKAEPVGGDF